MDADVLQALANKMLTAKKRRCHRRGEMFEPARARAEKFCDDCRLERAIEKEEDRCMRKQLK